MLVEMEILKCLYKEAREKLEAIPLYEQNKQAKRLQIIDSIRGRICTPNLRSFIDDSVKEAALENFRTFRTSQGNKIEEAVLDEALKIRKEEEKELKKKSQKDVFGDMINYFYWQIRVKVIEHIFKEKGFEPELDSKGEIILRSTK